MEAKKQMVTLVADGQKQDFEISHAERLLKRQNSGWKLPEDSQFKFDKNGIGVRENKKRSSATEKEADHQQGNSSAEPN